MHQPGRRTNSPCEAREALCFLVGALFSCLVSEGCGKADGPCGHVVLVQIRQIFICFMPQAKVAPLPLSSELWYVDVSRGHNQEPRGLMIPG